MTICPAALGTCPRRSDAAPSDTATIASAAGISSLASRKYWRVLNPSVPSMSENVVACRTTTRSRLPHMSLTSSAPRSVVRSVESNAEGFSLRMYRRNLGIAK